MRVAVIGAGPAGLAAVRNLKMELEADDEVQAFETSDQVGGVWVCNDRYKRSAIYEGLRTNIPVECMAFPDRPFPSHLPSYVKHKDVLHYLHDYAAEYDLLRHIKFRTTVEMVQPAGKGSEKDWILTYKDHQAKAVEKRMFDAVLVCNGHYSVPCFPSIPGTDNFTGRILHSSMFKKAEEFENQTVVLLGIGASGLDLALAVAKHAYKVYASHNKDPYPCALGDNVKQVPGIEHMRRRCVRFKDGTEIENVNAIIYCTGYRYSFPFLSPSCRPDIIHERVLGLYKHVISIDHPSLAFIGLCKGVVPFLCFYVQALYTAKWLARKKKGLARPSDEAMLQQEAEEYQYRQKELGQADRFFHHMDSIQWPYYRHLLEEVGKTEVIPEVRQLIFERSLELRAKDIQTYKSINFSPLDDSDYKEFVSS